MVPRTLLTTVNKIKLIHSFVVSFFMAFQFLKNIGLKIRNPIKCSKKTIDEDGIEYVNCVRNNASIAHKDAAIIIRYGPNWDLDLKNIGVNIINNIQGEATTIEGSSFFHPDCTVGLGIILLRLTESCVHQLPESCSWAIPPIGNYQNYF